jgi:hypothetical protein
MAEKREASLHEPDVPSVRALAIGGGAILAMVVVAVIVALLIVNGLTPRLSPPQRPATPAPPPALQPAPARDFPAFHRDKEKLLNEYAWVDRAHGVVRIPIERAMALLAQPGRQP